MVPPFTVRLLTWNEARPAARKIRELVFIIEQGVPRELEWDDQDEVSVHVLAFDGVGCEIGTARLLPDGHIGRMAVLSEWRRRGVGSALARALMVRALQAGCESVQLNAQRRAQAFYERLGFVPVGPEFQEAGIAHVRMTLLPSAPSVPSVQ